MPHIILKCIRTPWLLLALQQIRSETGTYIHPSPLPAIILSLNTSPDLSQSQLFVLPTGVALNKVNVRRSSVRQVKLNYTLVLVLVLTLVLVPANKTHSKNATGRDSCITFIYLHSPANTKHKIDIFISSLALNGILFLGKWSLRQIGNTSRWVSN